MACAVNSKTPRLREKKRCSILRIYQLFQWLTRSLQRLDSKRPPNEKTSHNLANPDKRGPRADQQFSPDFRSPAAIFSAVESERSCQDDREVATLIDEARSYALMGDETATFDRLSRAACELGMWRTGDADDERDYPWD
jgi:hypothetical protein